MATKPFGEDVVTRYDQWYETPWGRYADQQEKQLLLELAAPQPGERVLDVGCGTGRYLLWLRQMGLEATGVEFSPAMAQAARQRLEKSRSAGSPTCATAAGRGEEGQVIIADGHHLPFADDSFDLVITVTTLEFAAHPQQFLSAMACVCRGRIFLGVLNKSSLYYLQQRRRKGSTISQACFFSVGELLTLIRETLGPVPIHWRTTLLGPSTNIPILHTLTRCLDYIPGTTHLPWGAYIGVSVKM